MLQCSNIIIYGIKKGILSDKKGRTVFLNWELSDINVFEYFLIEINKLSEDQTII